MTETGGLQVEVTSCYDDVTCLTGVFDELTHLEGLSDSVSEILVLCLVVVSMQLSQTDFAYLVLSVCNVAFSSD